MLPTTQTVKKTQQNVTSSDTFKWGVIALFIIVLPAATWWISQVSIEMSRKYLADSANPLMKEVHERYIGNIITIFLASSGFLSFYYIIGHKYLPYSVFYMINLVLSLVLLVFVINTLKNIDNASKKNEYKKYVALLGTLIGFSAVVAVLTFIMTLYNLYSLFKGKPQQKKPQQK